MSSVGSVGAGSAAGAAGAASSGAASGGNATPSAGEACNSAKNTESNSQTNKTDEDKSGINVYNNMQINQYSNMSCQNFVELHNTANSSIASSEESSSIDMKKIIEMILAMKLLETLNDSSGGQNNGGFSTIA